RLLYTARWQPDPLGEADGGGFAQGRLKEGREVGIVAPLSQRQSGQRAKPAERNQHDELFPDRDHDVRAQYALETRSFAEIPQAPAPLADPAVQLAKGHPLIVARLADHTGRDDRTSDERHGPHYRVMPEDRS